MGKDFVLRAEVGDSALNILILLLLQVLLLINIHFNGDTGDVVIIT